MKIISYNVNGLRSAMKKGLVDWLKQENADVVCLQEIKANQADIDVNIFSDLGYHHYWFSAQKKGYSGVAILSKTQADAVFYGSNMEQSDFEGRVIRCDFGTKTIINAYFPSGTSGDERQQYKYQWLDEFQVFINQLKTERKELIICGDYNIAHHPIDIHNPAGNKKSSGFLPEERAWMTSFLNSGFSDSFRIMNPDKTGCFSWWSQRFPSVRLENKGWRIDYITTTLNLVEQYKKVEILSDIKHSDHCPISLEFNL